MVIGAAAAFTYVLETEETPAAADELAATGDPT
jgi:hypothetical protein